MIRFWEKILCCLCKT